MSGMLKTTIKNNIITNSTKYKNGQEKIGEIINVNSEVGTCTVNLISRDGLNELAHDVSILYDSKGEIPWEPKQGDYVRIEEQFKRLVIVGKVDLNLLNTTATSYYNDYYSDCTGGGTGLIF
jgi:hypothetical protein